MAREPLLTFLNRQSGRVTLGFLVLLTAGLMGFSAFLLSPEGTWSGDTGIRALQVRALRERGSFAVPYLGQAVDPENRWNPLAPQYFSWQADGYYPKFSPAYAVIVAAAEALAGKRSAAWPAALSLALTAGALWWALRAAGSRLSWAAAPALTLLSPLLFYANALWEHETAAALATVGAAALLAAQFRWTGSPRRAAALAALAGAAMGSGLWFRPELYVFIPAVGLAALVLFRRGWPLLGAALAGCAAALVPLLIVQQLLYGRAEGAHVAVDSPLVLRGATLSFVAGHFLRQWLATIPGTLVPQGPAALWAAAALALAGGVIGAARRKAWGSWLIVVGSASAGALALLSLALRLAPLDLVASSPVILVGLFALGRLPAGRRGAAYRFFGLAALAALLFALLTAPSPGGAQHGPRYLLLAYPLLIGCAILALEEWLEQPASRLRTAGLAAAAVLLVASAAAQAAGVRNLVVIHEQYARVARLMAALPPDPVVTDLWWFPQVIPAEIERRPIFVVPAPADVAELADRVAERGLTALTVVTSNELAAPLNPPPATAAGRRLRPEQTLSLAERRLVIGRYQIE
ncbi:MAG: hypothetical protein RMM58_11435 [Chloroflexota bacterium]|nr:hypothetical protein [Dehalococcoidia bacterium]MDW8254476.1 hypothetical protein [Chloroflexota bacterium]